MLDLRQIFSGSEFARGFRSLSKKKRKKLPQDLPRPFRYSAEKKNNALGKFIDDYRANRGPSLYNTELAHYKMSPYNGIAIPKKSGKLRPLLVPSPLERLVFLTALPRVKNVIRTRMVNYGVIGVGIESQHEDSEAIRKVTVEVQKHIQSGKSFVLVLDFQNFFSSIDRKKLFRRLQPAFKKHNEEKLWALVRASINNEIKMSPVFRREFDKLQLDKIGIPQGLAYSPLLASYFGTSIDRIVRSNKKAVSFRYLDDMIVLGSTREELIAMHASLEKTSVKLGLKLHELGTKTKIVALKKSSSTIEFLGVSISKNHLRIPQFAIDRFKEIVKSEILSEAVISRSAPEDVRRAFIEYSSGWSAHYRRVCPDNYDQVRIEINTWMQAVIEKKKTIKRLAARYPGVFVLK
jgi:RNA-directed DNA polymerase